MGDKMRLQKYMAKCGVASRRKSEKMISEGRVTINGSVVRELGTMINPKKDVIRVNNRRIKVETNNVYIMLNKPRGYVTTLKDKHNDKIVLDLIDGIEERI